MKHGPRGFSRREIVGGAVLGALSNAIVDCKVQGPKSPNSGGPLPDSVGVQLTESLAGHVGDTQSGTATSPFSLATTIRIPSLRRFLEDSSHTAVIQSGLVTWGLDVAPLAPGGQVQFFPDESGGNARRIVYKFVFNAANHGPVTVEAEKRFDSSDAADPVLAFSQLKMALRAGGAPLSGIVGAAPSQEIVRILSPDVLGAGDPVQGAQARKAFLDFLNNRIAPAYPTYPRPFQARSSFSPEAWYLLAVCAQLLLPNPLPGGGPTISDVLDELEVFIGESSSTQLQRLVGLLDFLASVIPIEDLDRPRLRERIRKELNGKPSLIRQVLQTLHLLIVFPYYAHPKGGALVGYTPPTITPRNRTSLPVTAVPPDRIFDVAIVGSGPAGSLLAQRLTQAGRSVLILEQGRYVAEHTLGSDEILATTRLYKESGLQQANAAILNQIFEPKEHPPFVILQGSCVGGGAMINNAVCFKLPPPRFTKWQAAGFPLAWKDLDDGYGAVATDLSIGPISGKVADPDLMLNPAPKFFSFEPETLGECLVNFEDFKGGDSGCAGNGLCNMGCGAERKRNALQVYLKEALTRDCVLVPEATAEAIVLADGGDGQSVDHIRVFLKSTGHHVRVRAREFILAAGAVASSQILLRSPGLRDLADRMQLPIGRAFGANIDSPIFAVCPSPVHSRTSVQMAHYVLPSQGLAGFVVESWFAPPGMLATSMPGFLDEHFQRMGRYKSTVGAAVLVGTESPGRVSLDGDKVLVDLPIRAPEIEHIRSGLAAVARAFLKGGRAGRPSSILIAMNGGREIRSESDVEAFERDLTSLENLTISTAHPQGGNALSDRGVVDSTFRVRGLRNLRVCDASVFPLSAGVNPQWTVMALAHCCAAQMTGSASQPTPA